MVYGKPHTFIIVRLQGHRAWRVIGSQKSLRVSSFSPYYFCGIVSACNQSDSFSSSFSMNVNCDLINPLINIPLLAVSSSETFLSQLEQIFMLREIITELFLKKKGFSIAHKISCHKHFHFPPRLGSEFVFLLSYQSAVWKMMEESCLCVSALACLNCSKQFVHSAWNIWIRARVACRVT